MSYQDSIDAMSGGSTVEGLFLTKKEVYGHLHQTDADMTAFFHDVTDWSKGKSGDDEKMINGFYDFYHRWKKYLKSTISQWYPGIQESENWRRRLIGWRRTFIFRGMKPTTPDPELMLSKEPYIVPILITAGGSILGAVIIDRLSRRKRGDF